MKNAVRCYGRDPELWFPLDERDPAQVAPAARVCASCPVRVACLEWALGAGVDHGVWGGLSSPQRRQLRRESREDRSAA